MSHAATQRAALADICRGRAVPRPTELLKPRFVRRGVPAATAPPSPSPSLSPPAVAAAPSPGRAVVFDEVVFDAACDDPDGGGGPARPVPMWVARPADTTPATAPSVVVLWLHGKRESRGDYLPVAARVAAARGCLFAAPDMPYHGGRRRPGSAAAEDAGEADVDALDEAVARAIRRQASGGGGVVGGGEGSSSSSSSSSSSNPLLLDWAWDAICALDALDALYGGGSGGRLTAVLAGTSMGGGAALLVAAALCGGGEQGAAAAAAATGGGPPFRRLAACAPVIALQYWQWDLENGEDAWRGRAESLGPALQAAIEVAAQAAASAAEGGEGGAAAAGAPIGEREAWRRAVARLCPGLLGDYDAPRVLAALRAAGVPLLACSSASDPRCPLGGVRAAWQEAEADVVEAAAGAGNAGARHELFVDDSARGHERTGAMMARVEAWLGELGIFGA
jgi:hypothetical protein